MLIDSHLHLSSKDYDDIEKVIIEANNNNVSYLIVSCCSMEDLDESLKIVSQYDNVYLTVGLHPSEVNKYKETDLERIEMLLKSNSKIIGVGEIGLDYYYGKEDKYNQQKMFIRQLEIASKLKLPVVIHTREATEDTINILKKYNLTGVIHCFTGSIETAKEYVKMGYKLGIGGVVTFKNSKLYQVVEELSLDNFILETDSPYLSPEPIRGKKNGPKNITIIAEKIAQIKNISVDEVAKSTTNSVIQLFDLKNLL